MSRRDLSLIGMGNKQKYDAWPHTRAELLNLRDLAMTEAQLDNVARIADVFDAEDQAWVDAQKVVRRAQSPNPEALDRFYVFNVMNILGYTSVAAFEADRKRGVIPCADGRDEHGYEYWRGATVEKAKGGAR